MRAQQWLTLCLTAALGAFLFCVSGENPYDDITKSMVVISDDSPVHEYSTVPFDTTMTLWCSIFLKEFIDSFSIHISHNTNWSDTTVSVFKETSNPVPFTITFVDTGIITITLKTYFTDGSDSSFSITVYAVSTTEDIAPPVISIMSGTVKKDSVFIPSFPFKLEVKAQDLSSDLDTLFMLNDMFDSVHIISQKVQYGFFSVNEQDFVTRTLPVIIFAEDTKGNELIDTFWLTNEHADSVIPPPVIIRENPANDTIVTYSDTTTIEGYIKNLTLDTLYLFVSCNGSLQPQMSTITKTDSTWHRGCRYTNAWNSVVIYCYDTPDKNTPPVDTSILYINYVDTTISEPVILYIKHENTLVNDSSTFDHDTLALVIAARKHDTGLESLSINGTACNQLNDSVFSGNAILTHEKTGTTVAILVKDSAGNTAADTLTLFYNHLPTVTRIPDFSSVYAESLFIDTVLFSDLDNDPVTTIAHIVRPGPDTSIAVSTQGVFAWMPALSDTTGQITITFTASDGYGKTDTTLTLKVKTDLAPPAIKSITCQGSLVTDSTVFRQDTLTLTILVQKQKHGILSVTTNAQAAQRVNDTVFTSHITLTHTKTGIPVLITATDSLGQVSSDTLRLFYNHAPVFSKLPAFAQVYAESLYVDTATGTDADGDTLQLTAVLQTKSGMTQVSVSSQGAFSITPALKDTAQTATMTFTLRDGYTRVDTAIVFAIHPPIPPSISFLVTGDDFSDSIDFRSDPLAVILSTTSNVSDAKLFTVLLDDTGSLHGPDSQDSAFSWTPNENQVGLHTLKIIVSAGSLHDTLTTNVYVKPIIVSFAEATSSALEGTNNHTVTVQLSRTYYTTASVGFEVNYTLSTASIVPQQARDYTVITSSPLSFNSAITQRTISLQLLADGRNEPNETVVLEITPVSPGLVVGTIATHICTIMDTN